jgi:hypothetical protein
MRLVDGVGISQCRIVIYEHDDQIVTLCYGPTTGYGSYTRPSGG